jgi:AcrR family transcriptional regulator
MAAEQVGLRERRRMRTMAAIQHAAFRLFAEQGYDATTVEQIAAAADVSPATFFRHFPAKEDVVRTDEFDPLLLDRLATRPAGEDVLTAVRATIASLLPLMEDVEPLRDRIRLLSGTAGLRAQMWDGFRANTDTVAAAIAPRLGRDPADLEARAAAAAVVAALVEAVLAWADPATEAGLGELVDRAMGGLDSLGP